MSPRTGSLSSSVGDKSSSEAAMTSPTSSSSASAGGGGSRRFTVRERGPVELLEVHTMQTILQFSPDPCDILLFVKDFLHFGSFSVELHSTCTDKIDALQYEKGLNLNFNTSGRPSFRYHLHSVPFICPNLPDAWVAVGCFLRALYLAKKSVGNGRTAYARGHMPMGYNIRKLKTCGFFQGY